MVLHNVFHHLLNIALTVAASQAVANAIVLKVVFVIALKQPLAVDVITADLVDDVCLTQRLDIINDSRGSDALSL